MVLSTRVRFNLREIQGTQTKASKKFDAHALRQEPGKLPLRQRLLTISRSLYLVHVRHASEAIAEAKQGFGLVLNVSKV